MKPIERDDNMQRDYIPLAGGYEFQTKGKGSTTRLACPDDIRHPLSDAPHVVKVIENMCRAQHAELARRQEQLRVAREALKRAKSDFYELMHSYCDPDESDEVKRIGSALEQIDKEV